MVVEMDSSLKFYVEGLGFEIKIKWTPLDTIEWCWLQREGAAIMLQEYGQELHQLKDVQNKRGDGVSIYFQCEDALELYQEFLSKGLTPSEPFVGNGMWVVKIKDPDGYVLYFESLTEVPEETTYSDWEKV
ncbi:MAG TPA: VOC family protein [Flavisolibacter sp.]|nr:VOC family protein [Flavisolibacter sp.]